MQTFSFKIQYIAVFIFGLSGISAIAQTKGRDSVLAATGTQTAVSPGSAAGAAPTTASTPSSVAPGTDSVRVQPPFKTQVRTGFHQLGTDIHAAFSTLKTEVNDAARTGKNILADSDARKESNDNKAAYDEAATAAAASAGTNAAAPAKGSARADQERHKIITKTYEISKNDRLDINNKYGEVQVVTWDKSQIKVEVSISVKGTSADRLDEVLNQITIQEARQTDEISLTTHIGDMGASTWDSWMGKHSSTKYQINYKISMPRQSALGIVNKYGKTILPDFDGPLVLTSAYGSLNAGALKNPKNQITVRYGKANIAELGNTGLDISYSDLTIARANRLNLTHKYGNLQIGQVNELEGEIAYSQVTISGLTGALKLNLRYVNKFDLNRIASTVRTITLDASYSRIDVSLTDNIGLHFDVDTRYGSFNFPRKTVSLSEDPDQNQSGPNFSKHYSGRLGHAAGDSRLKINSSYTNITLNQ